MHFDFTYDDIRLWMINFLDLNMHVCSYDKQAGQFWIETPAEGIRKLLPPGYLKYQQFFHVEEYDTNSITLCIYSASGSDDILNSLLVRYVNYCWMEEIMELVKYSTIKIHLDKIAMMHDITLQSLEFYPDGLRIDFADNPPLFEQLRMIQMLLRAGYKQIRIIPEDMGYTGYWFSDDALDYTLKMAQHPAEIRLWSSFHVPEWLGIDNDYIQHLCCPSYPLEQIYYQYGSITVILPVTIAEPEINAATIERNCQRLRTEIAPMLTELLYYSPRR